jgi:putative glutamine amidotransferase
MKASLWLGQGERGAWGHRRGIARTGPHIKRSKALNLPRPLIGITSDFNPGDREDFGGREPTYFIRARYVSAIQDLGGTPLILPITQDTRILKGLLDLIDGLLLTGSGPDLDPTLYGESKRYKFKIMSHERAGFELKLARMAVDRDLPVLGVCGGMQVLNIAFQGTLVQDIASEIKDALAHQQKAVASEFSHEIRITRGTRLSKIIREPVIQVNSSHHQAIKSLGQDLVVNAVAPDGVIEGLEHSECGFVLGVQWHPEFLYRQGEHHRRLFEAFLKKAAQT